MERLPDATLARRTDLDLVRVVACALVVLAHALLIFAADPGYHVKSREPWLAATLGFEALRIGTMAVFFALAGWAAVGSLRRKPVARFLRDRAARVLLPFVAGMALQGPVIKYIELSQGRDLRFRGLSQVAPLDMSFFEFLPRYLRAARLHTWSHLWYLLYLLVLSLLLLPALRWLARRAPTRPQPPRVALYLPALLLAVLVAGTGAYWPCYPTLLRDLPNLAYFAACTLLGGALAAWPVLEERLRVEAWGLLLLALVAFGGVVGWGESFAGRLCVGACAWGAIGATLGFAGRSPPRASRTLALLGEATLPIYILHHIPLLLLGALLLPLSWPAPLTIVALALGATALTAAVYVALVRPWSLGRRLVGLPPAPPKAPRSAGVGAGAPTSARGESPP